MHSIFLVFYEVNVLPWHVSDYRAFTETGVITEMVKKLCFIQQVASLFLPSAFFGM
jgi:hypothetical protein